MRIRILTGGYLLCLLLFVLSPVLLQPWLFLYGGGSRLLDRPARAGMAVTIRFIHSVQKTPVWEYLSVNDQADGFCFIKRSTSLSASDCRLWKAMEHSATKVIISSWTIWNGIFRSFICGQALAHN